MLPFWNKLAEPSNETTAARGKKVAGKVRTAVSRMGLEAERVFVAVANEESLPSFALFLCLLTSCMFLVAYVFIFFCSFSSF